MNKGAIIQARTSSSRLPNKVLRELPFGSGITVLEQVISRLKKSKNVNSIIVATTTEKADDRIVMIAKKTRVRCFRGSKSDVLSRYYFSALENKLDVIIRITSDCPCIDPKLVDLIIYKHINTKADYTSNALKRTFPRGFDVEVINFNALRKAFKLAKRNYEREHVTPYIYKNPDTFKISHLSAPKEFFAPDIRITLDEEEDYILLCKIFGYLYRKNRYFGISDIINLFEKKPQLKFINKKVTQKEI